MNARGFVTISMRELERVRIIEAVAEHRMKVFQAAERLQLSTAKSNLQCRILRSLVKTLHDVEAMCQGG